nr:GNAT family N-acetyltransferase [Dechloromonas sp.]
MSSIVAETVTAASAIPEADWRHLSPAVAPFLDGRFISTLEIHGSAGPACGWQAHHLLLKDDKGRLRGLAPTYLKNNSHGDFVRDWSWAAAYEQLGKRYYPKLLTGVPHTPARGSRLLVEATPDADALRDALVSAGKATVEANGLSSWHIAMPAEAEIPHFQAHDLLLSHTVQFQWRDRDYGDFAGYLAAFSSEPRRKVRAERRKVAESGLTIAVRHGDEIEPGEWPALHRLYASTFDKFGNYAAFTAGAFAELAATLGRRVVLFIAYSAGEPVAISICFRSDDTLYGRYWGTSGGYHSLHFELCFYQGIAYCLDQGLRCFEPGAGGEHKVARGFAPTIVSSCHWIADPRMRHLIGQHLARQEIAIRAYAEEATAHLPFRQEN